MVNGLLERCSWQNENLTKKKFKGLIIEKFFTM
jgi:hypothetical protein